MNRAFGAPQMMIPPGSNRDSSAKGTPDGFLSAGRFAAVLAGLIFASFPEVLLGLKTFVIRDYGFFVYPLAHFYRECFWHGEVPLWNPYNNCGTPFLAQWNTMVLYPPSLIYLLGPLTWSLGFFALLHLFVAGMGMFFLARKWTQNGFAAAIAGVAFAFNGMTLNLLMWPSHIATLSLVPWTVLCTQRAWRNGGRMIAAAAVVGALEMLAGGPETNFFTWTILLVLCLAESLQYRTPRFFGRFIAVGLLVAALAAAQLLPFLDCVTHAQRQLGYADTRWSMPASGIANFFVPMFYGAVSNVGVFFQYDQGWTSSYYLSIGVWLLAFVTLWRVREKQVWILTGIGLIALLFSFGDQNFLYRWLRQVVPQLTMICYPVKFVVLITFIAPVLAAFAVTRMESAWRKNLLIVAIAITGAISAILVIAWRFPFPSDDVGATLRNGACRLLFLAIITGSLTAALQSVGTKRTVLQAVVLLSLWVDVKTHMPSQNPLAPPWIYAPNMARQKLNMNPQPELGQSRAMVSAAAAQKFRGFALSDPAQNLVVKRLGYFADCNNLDRVPKVDGFLSLELREPARVISLLYESTDITLPALMDFLSVSEVTAPGKFFDWEARKTFMPVITAGQEPVFMDDDKILQMLGSTNFDGRTTVYLPPNAKGQIQARRVAGAKVLSSVFHNQHVEADVGCEAPTMVVIAQAYYHCWRAYVDGQRVALWRANDGFQALELPGGRHRVELRYSDSVFYAGVTISILFLVICGFIWLKRRHQ